MDLLYPLLVLLVVTRVFGEIAVRLRQPALVGELVSGIVLGLVVNTWSDVFPTLAAFKDEETFRAITDLGVFFLMLLAGVEMSPRKLVASSKGASLVAIGGMVVPLATGIGLGLWFLPASEVRVSQVLFLGTALAITAVPVATKVLMDLKIVHSDAGQTIVSAAIVDDILSLVLLAVLTSLLQTGAWPDAMGLLTLGGRIVLFFGITFVLGWFVLPWLARQVSRPWVEEHEFSILVIIALGFAVIAEFLHLHFILGAFFAGVLFTADVPGEDVHEEVQDKISAVTSGFLAPLFFASIGLHLELGALTGVPWFLLLLVVTAVVSKLVGAGLVARAVGLSNRDALIVGFGMSARGAVELIIADIAMRAGRVGQPDPPPPVIEHLFSSVVIMAVVTTLLAPLVLRALTGGHEAQAEPA